MRHDLHLPNSQLTTAVREANNRSTNNNPIPERIFEIGKFELWFQPVYQVSTGEVLHNEVLLRWRDKEGTLHLPHEVITLLSNAGWLPRLDRLVISKAIAFLARHRTIDLSVNLSESALKDESLVADIQSWLTETGVAPQRLSFELTETAIARDCSAAATAFPALKALGCSVVPDNFTGRELTAARCRQLAADLVKPDLEWLPSLSLTKEPGNQALETAIVPNLCRSTDRVVAKFITDDRRIELVEEVGFYGFQGHYLRVPSPRPDRAPLAQQLASVATSPMPNQNHSIASITIVIPALNEEGNLERLLLSLTQTFKKMGLTLPVLLIDDGSTDNSPQILVRLSAKYEFLRVIRHPVRQGVTGVWKTALAHVTTDWILWGQADLESDPRTDIPLLLSACGPGVDVVAGWRQKRGDGKVCASKFANTVCRWLFGLQIHDMNWIKLVRRDLLSAELLEKTTHRYLLAVLSGQGYNIAEVPTPWHPRYAGKSKFGPGRLLGSAIDFLRLLGWWYRNKARMITQNERQRTVEFEEELLLSLLGMQPEYCLLGEATRMPLN